MVNPKNLNPSALPSFLALAIGNSRLHFAYFAEGKLSVLWDTVHIDRQITTLPDEIFPDRVAGKMGDRLPLYIASVVPQQTHFWQGYPYSKIITLKHLPLEGIYPTMGIDRALAVYGAARFWGFPVLVIDGGTALTFTGIQEHYKLVGGAILSGLRSQFLSLSRSTAALPNVTLPSRLPERWSLNTEEAIASGIIYTILAGVREFIKSWRADFPDSWVIFTGGDGFWLKQMLPVLYPEFSQKIAIDLDLVFKGILAVVNLYDGKMEE
ncbi:MAG: pantothenate kinase [Cyanobacteria bacterium SBLK]|nr:pantothenate kinase [Cyanobacteria bacterium SBLK]